MGKRKHRQIEQVRWSREDEIRLLAWLDYSLRHKEINFNETVVMHMEQKYTLPKIEGKLYSIWAKHGPDEAQSKNTKSSWRHDLFTQGSACLHNPHGLDAEVITDIARELQSLEDACLARQISTTPKRLRRSRYDASTPETIASTTSALRANRRHHSQRHRNRSDSVTPSRVKRETESIDVSSRGDQAHKNLQGVTSDPVCWHVRHKVATNSKKSSRSPFISTRSLRSSPCFPAEPGVKVTRARSRTIVNDSEESSFEVCDGLDFSGVSVQKNRDNEQCSIDQEMSDHRSERNDNHLTRNDRVESTSGDTDHTAAGIDTHDASVMNVTETLKLESALEEIRSLTEQLQQTREEWQEFQHFKDTRDEEVVTNTRKLEGALQEISSLTEQLQQMREELQESQNFRDIQDEECASLKEAQRQRDKEIGGPIEETIQRYNNLRKKLQTDDNDRGRLLKFTRLGSQSREWLGKDIQPGFEDIYAQSQQLLCRNDCQKLPYTPSLETYSKLQELVYGCLGINSHDPLQSDHAIVTLSQLSPQAVIRALTTCALRDWVFEQNVCDFDEPPSVVLGVYRRVISIHDGSIALRNLDLAAFEMLVNEAHFQKRIIPEKAKSLAVSLSQVLAPFFSDAKDPGSEFDWDGFATWRDDTDEWHDRRDRLNAMFENALRLKAESCLNIEDYEMVIYPPDTPFNRETMIPETGEGMLDTIGNREGLVVQITTQAAVFAYAKKPLLNNSLISKALITSTNFVRKTAKERAAIRPRVRAVVVLKS